MPPICDICGKHLAPVDVKTIEAGWVVNATSKGYVPANLPPTWKPQCEMLGVSVASHWKTVVRMNSSADWGLCQECLEEIERFSAKAQARAGGSAPGEPNPIVNLESTLILDLGGDVKLELALIPLGKFMMGRPAHDKGDKTTDEPQHEVAISRAFYMGKYVVTQEHYDKVMGTNPSRFKGAKRPVDNVFWDDAQDFCKKVTATTGKALRLPTEAEWEYACRAGSTTAYCFGDTQNELVLYAWCLNVASLLWSENKPLRSDSDKGTHPVGEKKPNRWGLYDMHGNVLEWCQDRFGRYSTGAVTDPQGPAEGEERVLRGGQWRSLPDLCNSTSRSFLDLVWAAARTCCWRADLKMLERFARPT